MKIERPHTLRVVGVLGVLVAYGLFRATAGEQTQAFVFVIFAIIALVAPEVISELPYGPSK